MALSGAHIIAESLVEDGNVFDNRGGVSGAKVCDGVYVSRSESHIDKEDNKKKTKKIKKEEP